ncbi:universal stress protein [Rhizobium rhizogenes]|uniref:universal stress protein n=1 Tax=Rhizobium rhizogenes TaxID=359 RepID=UPI00385797A6
MRKDFPLFEEKLRLAGNSKKPKALTSLGHRSPEERRKSQSLYLIIQQAALGLGADILVMGAFRHSRLRDFILVGATDGVLERPILPVLMSH